MEGLLLKPGDARALVFDHQAALPPGFLRRYSRRAGPLVAIHRLDAAEREHEGARGIAPVGAQREGLGHLRAGMDLARDSDLTFDLRFRPTSMLRTMICPCAVAFHGIDTRAGQPHPALRAVDGDEIGVQAGIGMALPMAKACG